MNPVNSPWVCVVGFVYMRCFFGYHDKLACFDTVFSVPDTHAAAAFDTIDQYMLIGAMLSLTEMMLCFGIITNICYVEWTDDIIIFDHGRQY